MLVGGSRKRSSNGKRSVKRSNRTGQKKDLQLKRKEVVVAVQKDLVAVQKI